MEPLREERVDAGEKSQTEAPGEQGAPQVGLQRLGSISSSSEEGVGAFGTGSRTLSSIQEEQQAVVSRQSGPVSISAGGEGQSATPKDQNLRCYWPAATHSAPPSCTSQLLCFRPSAVCCSP